MYLKEISPIHATMPNLKTIGHTSQENPLLLSHQETLNNGSHEVNNTILKTAINSKLVSTSAMPTVTGVNVQFNNTNDNKTLLGGQLQWKTTKSSDKPITSYQPRPPSSLPQNNTIAKGLFKQKRSTLKMNNIQIKTTSQSSISVPRATTTASSTENGVLASNNKSGPFIVCPVFSGGLGNMMFEFASSFGIAMKKGINVVISSKCELMNNFKLNVDIRQNTSICNAPNTQHRHESQSSAFDSDMIKFDNKTSVRLTYFLQSFLYFNKYYKELKQQFIFKDHIQEKVKNTFTNILSKFNVTKRDNVTIIGIHIRRGNMVSNAYGYNVASKQYLYDAVQWYTSRYQNIFFIAASNDYTWTKANMPSNISVDYLPYNNSPAVDMAIVSMCDHFISTVGSFSWWCGWLTGGNVTYYKWPAKEGSTLRKCYSKDYADYFLPNWIGL